MRRFRMNLAVVALSMLMPAAIPSATAQTPDGAGVFSQRCARCHSIEKVSAAITKRPALEREAYLQQFLQKHFPPPVETRAGLIAYLMKPAGK